MQHTRNKDSLPKSIHHKLEPQYKLQGLDREIKPLSNNGQKSSMKFFHANFASSQFVGFDRILSKNSGSGNLRSINQNIYALNQSHQEKTN